MNRFQKSWLAMACSIFALSMLIASCQTTPNQQKNISIITLAQACQAYSAALRVLAPRKAVGLLSEEEIATVNRTNVATDQVCIGSPPADSGEAVMRVSNAVTTVMLIVATEEN